MENVRLLSEGFENAAYALKHSMDNFQGAGIPDAVCQLNRATDDFRISVDKLVRAMGMTAENQRQAFIGDKPRYVEMDFLNL